jgi:hypothetical protein
LLTFGKLLIAAWLIMIAKSMLKVIDCEEWSLVPRE